MTSIHQHLDFDRVCVLALSAAQTMAAKLPLPQGVAWDADLYSKLNEEQVFTLVEQFVPFLSEEGVLSEQARFEILMQQINEHHPQIDEMLSQQQHQWQAQMKAMVQAHKQECDASMRTTIERLERDDVWNEVIPGSTSSSVEPPLSSLLGSVSILVDKPLAKPQRMPFPPAIFLEDRDTRRILFALSDRTLFERIEQSQYSYSEIIKRQNSMVGIWFDDYKKKYSTEWRHINEFFGAVQRQDQNTIKRIKHSDLVYQYNHVGPAAGWAAASSKAEKLYDMIFKQNQEVHVQIAQNTSEHVGLLLADKAKRCMDHVVALASTRATVVPQEPNDELVVIETPTLEQFRQRQQQDQQHARSVQP